MHILVNLGVFPLLREQPQVTEVILLLNQVKSQIYWVTGVMSIDKQHQKDSRSHLCGTTVCLWHSSISLFYTWKHTSWELTENIYEAINTIHCSEVTDHGMWFSYLHHGTVKWPGELLLKLHSFSVLNVHETHGDVFQQGKTASLICFNWINVKIINSLCVNKV